MLFLQKRSQAIKRHDRPRLMEFQRLKVDKSSKSYR